MPGGVNGNKRLCWNTSGAAIQTGWRCGTNDSLNFNPSYERLIFQRP
jgi:hypothetical protein